MKKCIFLLFLVLFLLSCEDSSKDVAEQTYPVVISLSNVRSSLPVPESKDAVVFNSHESLLNKLGVVYYLVFDANGKFVRQVKQLKDDESFGKISDELKIGQYTIVLMSCTGELTVGTTLSTLAGARVMATPTTGDIFYKKIAINVTAQGVAESAMLDRMVGCVQARITDRISDNISRIELQIENETPFFNISTGEVDVINKQARSVSANVDASNRTSFSLSLLVMNNQDPIIANLMFFDASHKLISSKRLPGITNVRGEKVSAEGKLSEFLSVGFTIGVNDAWPSDSTIVYF